MAIKKTSVDKHSSRCDTNLGPNATQKRRMDGHGHGEIARRRQGKTEVELLSRVKTDEKKFMERSEKKRTREFELLHDPEKHKRREERETKKKKKTTSKSNCVRRTYSTHEELKMHCNLCGFATLANSASCNETNNTDDVKNMRIANASRQHHRADRRR